jgi:hypothetical protein
MGDGVKITYEVLDELHGSLSHIYDELDHATSRSEDFEDAIGAPFGDNTLRKEAQSFEEEWDDKRNRLKEDVGTVLEHTQAILEGWKKWDQDAANTLESSA